MYQIGECCYLYGSAPRNDSNCVPADDQLSLICAIYNPRDSYTNLTVTWFRSATQDTQNYEEIPTVSDHYVYRYEDHRIKKHRVGNCSLDIYEDVSNLIVVNFTRNDNGYYWCQIAINNTRTQRSPHAWFYAGEPNATCNLPQNRQYYRTDNINESLCVDTSIVPSSTTGISQTPTRSQTSSPITKREMTTLTVSISETKPPTISIAMTTTTSMPTMRSTQQEIPVEQSRPLVTYYVAGSLSVLILLLGALVVVLSIMYLCKFRKKKTSKSPKLSTALIFHSGL